MTKKDEIIEAILNDQEQEEEMLLEMAVIGRIYDKNRACKYTIIVDEETTRIGNPYFKLFDNRNRNIAEHSLRISFLEAKAIYHKDRYKPIPITKELGEYIDNFMTSKNPNNPTRSNWVECIIQYNMINGDLDDLENVTSITKDVIDSDPEKYRRCIPVDLEKPTYANMV